MNEGLDRAQAAEWLAQAHTSPPQARAEWREHGLALLPLGVRFAAVRVRAEMVRAAMGGFEENPAFAVALGELLGGPVIHDAACQCFYALVAPDAGDDWAYPDVAPFMCSDGGTLSFLGVPRIDRTTPPLSYWVVPLLVAEDGTVPLCSVPAVSALVEVGRGALALVEAQDAYRSHLDHLQDCAICRAGVHCPTGEAFAGSLRSARDTARGVSI